jgi:glycine betaine catabolism A
MVGKSSSSPPLVATLSSADYCAPEVFELERRRIFHSGWSYVCHVDGLPAGGRRVFDLAGESVVVSRTDEGTVHAFANVCRHRGAQLCAASGDADLRATIRCGYHGWTYGLDGSLIATPRVDDEFDRDLYGLWPRHVAEWNGLLFVSVAEQPEPFDVWLNRVAPGLHEWVDLPVPGYRLGARTNTEVAANWKVLIENYAECLHCAVVHPELVNLVPLYRSGHVVPPDHPSTAVGFREGATAFTADGQSTLATLPGLDGAAEYDGYAVFPNLFFDVTPTVLALTALFPIAADRTRVVTEYVFDAAAVDRQDFDPHAEVEFSELIAAQDYSVCEMVQRGVASSAFTSGALTAKDRYVADFVSLYRRERGAVDAPIE